MSECVRCKSKCKLPIFCNSCYQESFKSGERRGRVEEIRFWLNQLDDIHYCNEMYCEGAIFKREIKERLEKRLLELQGVEK